MISGYSEKSKKSGTVISQRGLLDRLLLASFRYNRGPEFQGVF